MERAMPRFLILLALLLAGCASDAPISNPPPPVHMAPRPGAQVFAADWTPPLGALGPCDPSSSPFTCDHLPEGSKWGVLAQEGNGGLGCIDPQPNVCFQPVDGILNFHSGSPGMALLSAQTFDRNQPMSIEAVVSVTNDCRDVSFMGPVIYGGGVDDGDPTGTYAAAYISCTSPSDPPKLWLYRPTIATPTHSGPVSPGPHTVRIDYRPGYGFDLLLDGVVVQPEEHLSNDPVTFPHDPHAALWFGLVDGNVGRFDLMVGK
jgi:hypothetical protein